MASRQQKVNTEEGVFVHPVRRKKRKTSSTEGNIVLMLRCLKCCLHCCVEINLWNMGSCVEMSLWNKGCCVEMSLWNKGCCVEMSLWNKGCCVEMSMERGVTCGDEFMECGISCEGSNKCKHESLGECLGPQSLISTVNDKVDHESRSTDQCDQIGDRLMKVGSRQREDHHRNDIDMCTCPVCHSSFHKFDEMTTHAKMVHADRSNQLHQFCGLESVLSHDVDSKDGGKTINIREGFVILTESRRENSSKLKLNSDNIPSDQQPESNEVPVDLCHHFNDCQVTFQSEDNSTYSGELKVNTDCVLLGRTRKKLYKCEFCYAEFSFKCMLVQHRRTHTGEKPFKCDVCNVGFTHKCHLQDHKRIHTGERPYKCDVCGAGFTQKGHIAGHKRVHTGEKPYRCDLCGAGFAQKCNLYQHIKIHTGEKPYQCDVCGIRFSQKGNLQEHFKTHTGERSYTCEHCGQKFSRKDRLEEHKTVRTRRRPFKCDVCGIGFACRGLVLEHKTEHTHEEGLHKS